MEFGKLPTSDVSSCLVFHIMCTQSLISSSPSSLLAVFNYHPGTYKVAASSLVYVVYNTQDRFLKVKFSGTCSACEILTFIYFATQTYGQFDAVIQFTCHESL